MLGQFQYSLCFYNGAEETVLTDALSEYSYLCASDVPVIVYEAYASLSTKPVKLSEIETVDDAETMFEAALSSSSERYVAVAGTATAIAQEKEAKGFRINASGTMIYYIDNIPEEKNYGDLYRISISNGVPGKPEVYDNDVYTGGHCFISDTEFQYFKDYKDGQGELYINKDKIGFDVEVYRVSADSDLGKVFYFTDWDDDRYRGTLRVYDRNESVKIADDVQSYSAMPDGRVLYLCDYSLNYYKGELREWSDGETKKIDDDVICMIPISDSKYRGYTYGW